MNKTTENKKPETPLPCPFCAEPKIVYVRKERCIVLKCGNCGAQTSDTYCNTKKEDSLELWNQRKWLPEKNY